MAFLVGAGLAMFAVASVRILRGRRGKEDKLLRDGAVLLVSEGVVQAASPGALALLGDCTRRRIDTVLEDFFGASAPDEFEAIARLEQTGDPLHRLCRTDAGVPYELIGAPSGALIRLVLREARYLDERLRESEARVHAAEAVIETHSWDREVLSALVTEGSIIAWHRTAAGVVNWSAGQIRTRTGAVTPEQAIEMIAVRTRLGRQPTSVDDIQRSRIEIVAGSDAETVSLHVVEIPRQDGSWIGFGTDAGSAARAERTLSHFVQTMTETFAHLTVGLAIFDRNQTLALFNPALVQMWNMKPAWLARRPRLRDVLDALRATRRVPEVEDFQSWRARLLGLFENTEAASYEELWHLADGSNIRVLARPHPHGALAFTFDDVTERMRLEQRYRHSIDLRRATLDGLSEGVAVFGANGLLQFVNEAFHEIWGTDGDSVCAAMHARQLIALCERIAVDPEVWQKLHGFITGEESRRTWTSRLRTGDGHTLTARFAPLPDGSTLAVFSDVTDSERAAEALLDSDATLELSEATRDALSLLASIASEQALAAGEDKARAASPGEKAPAEEAAAQSDIGLAGTLHQVAAITAQPLHPLADGRRGDPSGTLEFIAAIAAPSAEQAGVTLVADTARAPHTVLCPAGRLGQVALQMARDTIARAEAGETVVLRAEGTAENFALHAECGACGALLPDGEGERLARLVARHGGQMEIVGGEPGVSLRITCRLGVQRPEQQVALPAGASRASAVRALRSGTR